MTLFPARPAAAVAATVAGWIALALPGLIPARPAAADDIAEQPLVIDSGKLAGKQLPSGVRAYLGVPFAAPPVRELRWHSPQPVAAWQGIYHAERTAPECIQSLRAHDINHYFGEEATSEDCLYLNIWAPPREASGPAAPVVVWIYGGGFTIGSASMANYRGESLARKGVVYVALAYRLGALGFLAHPELTAESPQHASGNYGLLDQIAALQWIQRNIASFGGDPRNVTIMGQSAGSMSVSVLQASPLARGLFHRAVGMSGSAVGSGMGHPQTLSAAEQSGLQLQATLKAPSLAAMRQLPADRILAVQGATGRYAPLVDGWLLPEDPATIFAAGKQNDVPVLLGYTRNDLNQVAPQMRSWSQAQATDGKAPVYMYLFSRVHPYTPGVMFADHDPATVGAYHTADVPYWLQTLDSLNLFRVTRSWTAYDRDLAERMSDALVNFARTGVATISGVSWPAYRRDRERVVELGDTIRVIPLPMGATTQSLTTTSTPATGAKPVLEDRYPERRIAFPNGVTGLADVTYSTLNGFRPLTLDLYLPATPTNGGAPVIVYVHGGGWTSGHTRHSGAFEDWPGVLASLAAKGYVIASVSYRLSSEAPSPAAEQDIKSALRWLRSNASRYGIDKTRVGIWGGSAGGQLAALAGTSCGVAALDPPPTANGPVESDCVQSVVTWYGIFDFEPLARNVSTATAATRYLGCISGSCSDEEIGLASAIRHIDRSDPPFLLIHGALDKTVAPTQSQAFHAALQAHGVKSQLLMIADVDHSFVGSTAEATRSASLRALQATFEFFDATLARSDRAAD